MNIFILVSKLYPWIGGTETQTETIADELHKRGHNVTVLTRKFPGSNMPSTERRDVLFRRFAYPNYPVIRYVFQFFNFLNGIRKNRKNVDVLLCMQLTPNGLIGIAAKKLFRIPVISYVRGGDWYFSKGGFFGRMIISRVLRKSDLVLTQTEKIKNEILEEFPKTRIKVIPNGIHPYPKRAEGRNIIFVGNLIERKGVKYLIDAMKGMDERLVIVGSGTLERELKKRSKGQNVFFTGYLAQDKIRDFMCRNGKVFVLPAIRGEGLPNAILEAMSVGLPVVATNIAGIPDIVRDGKTGFIVEPKDTEGLKEAIKKITTDNKLHGRMSTVSLKEIKKYHWENVIKQLEDVMSSFLPQ